MAKSVVKVVQKAKPKASLNRRWFANMSGWGLQLSLGSGDASAGKTKRSIGISPDGRLYVKQSNVAVANFLHNTIYTHNVMLGIAQGTTQSTRLGNEVFVKNIQCSFWVDTFGAVAGMSGISLRIMLVALTQQYTAVDFTSGVGSSDMFFGSATLLTVARPDPRLCRVLCDDVVHIQPSVPTGVGANGVLKAFSFGCAVNQPFEYRAGTNFGSAANLYLIAIPCVSGGVNGTTTVAAFGADTVVSFTSK